MGVLSFGAESTGGKGWSERTRHASPRVLSITQASRGIESKLRSLRNSLVVYLLEIVQVMHVALRNFGDAQNSPFLCLYLGLGAWPIVRRA